MEKAKRSFNTLVNFVFYSRDIKRGAISCLEYGQVVQVMMLALHSHRMKVTSVYPLRNTIALCGFALLAFLCATQHLSGGIFTG
jgi:hypothetical protein